MSFLQKLLLKGLIAWSDHSHSKVVGLYIGSNSVTVVDRGSPAITRIPLSQLTSKSDYLGRIAEVFQAIRKQYKRWPPLWMFLCTAFGSAAIPGEFLHHEAEKNVGSLHQIDFRMCLAIGLGLNVTDSVKSILVLVNQTQIHICLLFAANFFYEASYELSAGGNSLSSTLEQALAQLKASVQSEIPERLKGYKCSDDEMETIRRGWQDEYDKDIHLVFLDYSTHEDLSISGHRIVIHRNVEESIAQGLKELIHNYPLESEPIKDARKRLKQMEIDENSTKQKTG